MIRIFRERPQLSTPDFDQVLMTTLNERNENTHAIHIVYFWLTGFQLSSLQFH